MTAWTNLVQKIFRAKNSKNASYKLKHAMKDAAKVYKKHSKTAKKIRGGDLCKDGKPADANGKCPEKNETEDVAAANETKVDTANETEDVDTANETKVDTANANNDIATANANNDVATANANNDLDTANATNGVATGAAVDSVAHIGGKRKTKKSKKDKKRKSAKKSKK
jgi:hypothetical protein